MKLRWFPAAWTLGALLSRNVASPSYGWGGWHGWNVEGDPALQTSSLVEQWAEDASLAQGSGEDCLDLIPGACGESIAASCCIDRRSTLTYAILACCRPWCTHTYVQWFHRHLHSTEKHTYHSCTRMCTHPSTVSYSSQSLAQCQKHQYICVELMGEWWFLPTHILIYMCMHFQEGTCRCHPWMSTLYLHNAPTHPPPPHTHTSINAPVYKHWHLRVLCIWICASIYRFLNDPAKLQRWWLWGESIFPWTLDRAKIFWLGSPAPSCVLGCLPTL